MIAYVPPPWKKGFKHCPKCRTVLPLTSFYIREDSRRVKAYYSGYCKSCTSIYYKAYLTSGALRAKLLKKFKVTEEELPKYCEVCGTTEMLNLDHDHKTGEYRGVLCSKHNTGLGMFQDNPEYLINALIYLRT